MGEFLDTDFTDLPDFNVRHSKFLVRYSIFKTCSPCYPVKKLTADYADIIARKKHRVLTAHRCFFMMRSGGGRVVVACSQARISYNSDHLNDPSSPVVACSQARISYNSLSASPVFSSICGGSALK